MKLVLYIRRTFASRHKNFQDLGTESESPDTITTTYGDATPAVIRRYLGGHPSCSHRELWGANLQAWFRVTDVFRNVGIETVEVGGRYPAFHPVTNKNGEARLKILLEDAKGRPNASRWLQKGLIPGGNVGQVIHKLLASGLDVSISPVSSPAVKVEATDFIDNPQMQNFF